MRRNGCSYFSALLLVPLSALSLSPLSRATEPDRLRGQVQSLEFTSDHKMLRQAADLLSIGERFPDIHWCARPRSSVPISHSGGEDVRIRAVLRFSAENASGRLPFVLQGSSDEPCLQFRARGTLSEKGQTVVELEALRPLGSSVRRLNNPIDWTLTVFPNGKSADSVLLGTTGPHVVYVTAGAPRHTDRPESAVTVPRLELALERLAGARRAAGESASGPRLVYELMKQNGDHYLPNRHYRGAAAWQVPASWRLEPSGASCIAIVDFVRLVCDITGVEGETQTRAYCARAANPMVALRGGLGDPPEIKRGSNGANWQLFLVDHTNTNHGQVGGVGGMNYYEGTLEYTWNGQRYYYPGGTDRVYAAPEQVLSVFRTLAWAEYEERRRDWVVREVVRSYVGPGQKFPESVRLP